METVIDPMNAFPSAPEIRIICRVCQKQFSQYTCPRCNTRYCSLQCYKNHGLRCTESFMRENVEEEMRQIKPEEETKRKMLDILKRFHSKEEDIDSFDDGDDSMLSEETILKVLSGNKVNLGDLSPEEIKQFRKAIASGELSKMIEPWIPWWLKLSAKTISLSQEGAQLVRPIQELETPTAPPNSDPEGPLSEVPQGPDSPLVPISKLIRTEPSPLLAVHLLDVIYSYCFTLRLYNGDWQSDSLGASMVVLSVSTVLGEGGQPETVGEALIGCLEQTCSPAFGQMGGSQFGLGLMEDVISLLSLGGNALLCALSDLQRLIQGGEKEMKAEKQRVGRKGAGSKLRQAERKVYFLTCWVHEQMREVWLSLAALVGAEKAAFAAMAQSTSVCAETKGKDERKGKAMIQEVP